MPRDEQGKDEQGTRPPVHPVVSPPCRIICIMHRRQFFLKN